MRTPPRGASARPSTRSYLLFGPLLAAGTLLLGGALWIYPGRGASPRRTAAPQSALGGGAAASHVYVAASGPRDDVQKAAVPARALRAQPSAVEVAPPEPQAANGEGPAVRGVVQDALGGPIAGAQISVRPLEGETETGRGVSDADGRFELRLAAGWVVLTAIADGYSRGRAEVIVPERQARLVLAPQSLIQGRVVHAGSGKAVAQVGVTATATTLGGSRIDPVTAVSDSRGEFRLAGLPAGTFQVSALAPSYRGGPVSVMLAVGEISPQVLLPVQEGATLHGLVVAGGEPCAAAVVTLTGPLTLYGTAGNDGGFTLPGVLQGRYDVRVECPAGLPLADELVVREAPVRVTWKLERGLEVTGTLTRASGAPLEGGIVTCTPAIAEGVEPDSAVREVSCKTDPRGEFWCAGLEPRRYRCGSSVRGITQQGTAEVDLASSVGTPRLSLVADPSADLHVAVDIDGQWDARLSSIVVFARRGEGPVLQAEQRADGFWFRSIPLGEYRVYFGPSTEDPRESSSVSVSRDGEQVRAGLELPRLATLRGQVQDEQGNALPEVWVRATSPDPGWSLALESAPAVLSDGDGRFVLSALMPGRHALSAGCPVDCGSVEQRVSVAPGQELDLTLVLRRTLTGHDPTPALAGVETETTK